MKSSFLDLSSHICCSIKFSCVFLLLATGLFVLAGSKSPEASAFHSPNPLARSTQDLFFFFPEIPSFLWPGSQKKTTHQPRAGRNEAVSDTWTPNRAHATTVTDCCSSSPAPASVPFQILSSCRDHFHNRIFHGQNASQK